MTLSARGTAVTRLWESDCKDCRAERDALAAAAPGGKGAASPSFEYSAAWVDRVLQRGGSRSDRCEFHRRAHAQAIKALAVPYIDLQTLGEVADQANPTGPLGGLGPLPVLHAEKVGAGVDLGGFKFGMSDEDILTILAGLTDKRVAVVEAGTGTGKSTFMPFRLMNPPPGAALQVKEFGPIVVTEPRRAAATGVARYVGEELCFGCDSKTCDRHIGPGFPVGYQVSGEKRWDTACDLIYVTDGTMINWVRDGQLSKIGMVIIDEAHERSENIDIILAQLREQLRVHQHLRVIITSATLDRDFFVAYFGGEQAVFTCSIPATKSFGYGVPLLVDLKIDEGVIESGLSLGDTIAFPGWSSQGPDTGDGPEDLRATTRALASLRCVEEIEITRWRDKMPDAVARQVVAIAEGTQWGDILAFLPTSEVIANTVKAISRALAAKGLEFDVFPLLSTTDPKISEQARAARSRGDKRKIVVSSNLAETSLTVEGVRYVVDSGLICQSEWDPALVSGGFPTKPHSQSGLRQRWGRVGRDAPGWVFPLYTAEQFLSLAKNTAPESTRVNLESFHAKLVSSGLDMDEAVLPGDFVHDEAALDKQGREDIEVFRRESARARRTLTATGMTDAHGHLTEFGRELERFPGGGSNALAMMLADQLACVHEVALALEVLGQGRLIGEREESLLRVDPEWPPAWRARAVQCHRALAVGCEDDLDVLLRIASLWQSAADQRAWCGTWWVNSVAMESAMAAVASRVGSLSNAMKTQAARPLSPRLGGRARAVLTRAMASLRYRRVAGDLYQAEDEGGEEVKLGPARLFDGPDRIIAFNRFRRGRRGKDKRPGEISHLVKALDWAVLDPAEADATGFDLLLKAAAHLPDPSKVAATDSQFLAVLALLPIGSVLRVETTSRAEIKSLGRREHIFRAPRDTLGKAGKGWRGPPSGFDPDRDFTPSGGGELPEEEEALLLLRISELESNEAEGGPSPPPTAVDKEPVKLPRLFVARLHSLVPVVGIMTGVVAAYYLRPNGRVVLLIDEIAEDAILDDPANHPDLTSRQALDVTVAGLLADHDGAGLLQLDRVDLHGRFYLAARGAGLHPADEEFLSRLEPGTLLNVRAFRKGPTETTVLLPMKRVVIPMRITPVVDRLHTTLQQRFGVSIRLSRYEGIVLVEGPTTEAVASAARVVVALASGPRLSATIAPEIGKWLGRDQQFNLRLLEARPGVSFVWSQGDVATVLGTRAEAVADTLRDVVKPVCATLSVPKGKSGRLVGKGGATLKRFSRETLCLAENEGDDRWMVRGPTEAQVDQFLQLAANHIPGASGQIFDRGQIEPLPDPPQPLTADHMQEE